MRKLLLVTTVAILAAPAASAKEGAQAHLLRSLPAHHGAGTLITIRWTVTVPGSAGKREPFSAIGMFVRLVGANHATTTATAPQKHGPPYSVRIRVPRGAIRAIRFGLHGRNDNGPSDIYFPLK